MRIHLLHASLALSCLLLPWISGVASLPSGQLRGVVPQDEGYYKAAAIKCKDGSRTFAKEQLNDEFCDCLDGTDEPGTSACPEGKFYCRNAGHIPGTIFSSRVNDGICDCCDGSDEYNGSVNCQNTCWEAGEEAREKLRKEIAVHQDGLAIRKKEVEKAKEAFAKDEAELLKLENEEKILKDLVDKLQEHKEQIEKVENEERLRRENEEKEKGDTEQDKSSEGNVDVNQELSVQLQNEHNSGVEIPADGTQVVDDHGKRMKAGHDSDDIKDEVSSGQSKEKNVLEDEASTLAKARINDEAGTKEIDPNNAAKLEHTSDDTEGLSKEELGRHVASRWTGEQSAKERDEPNGAKEEGLERNQYSSDNEEEDDENYNYNSDSNDDRYKHDAKEFEDDEYEEYEDDHVDPNGSYHANKDDDSELSGTSWLDKVHQTVQNVFQAFNFFTSPVNISDATRVRKEYDDANSKLSKLRSRISSLTEKLKHDFGKEKEFYKFHNHCFESKQNKYVYKVCPFKKASQVDGHSTTLLGNWGNFDESYTLMKFSDGDSCWNGPDRSLKVRLKCGLEDELAEVDEPSRCEYVAVLTTPILCSEDKLKELQQKLEEFTKYQSSKHDEL